jgi:hypothetical protein
MPHVAAWYRREDYQRIRKIMDDGDKLPSDFDEWEKRAKGQVAEAKRSGIIIEPIILDPDDFVAYCKAEKLRCGSQARAKFVIIRGAAKSTN